MGLGHRWREAEKVYAEVNLLFGDSSAVVHYMRFLGWNLNAVEQTGSNFGADLQHETPFLVEIGRGTMIADGATLIDADYSSTSFSVTPPALWVENTTTQRL